MTQLFKRQICRCNVFLQNRPQWDCKGRILTGMRYNQIGVFGKCQVGGTIFGDIQKSQVAVNSGPVPATTFGTSYI